MFRHFQLGLVVFLVQLTVVVAFLCQHNTCGECVTSSRFTQCRWCMRDNKCHTPFADTTNPCSRAENIVEKSHCANELPHYDTVLSMKMLLLSAVAYDPEHPQECLDNSLPSDEFQLQNVFTKKCDMFENECSGYVAVSHAKEAIAIAFRGSKKNQALLELLESLLLPETQFLNGKVQVYWKSAFDALWSSMEAEVKALVSKYPSYRIWVTGHSLGAAIASLASTWLSYYNIAPRKNIILYTFGMPRVGNYDYALQHDQLVNNSWRVVNDDDLVPHFPFLDDNKPSELSGPYHHGVEVFYSEVAVSVNSSHRECHDKPYNEDATCSFSEKQLSIERHLNYFSVKVGSFCKTKRVRRMALDARNLKQPGAARIEWVKVQPAIKRGPVQFKTRFKRN